MAYATVERLQARMVDAMSRRESQVAEVILEDASGIIDDALAEVGLDASAVPDSMLERICCAIASRYMEGMMGTDGAMSQIGMDDPFASTSLYRPRGELSLTRKERDALQGVSGGCSVSFATIAV